MAVNKYAVAGGVVVGAAVVGAGVVYCRRDFAEAVAVGDFARAERRAGLLAVNDISPMVWPAVMAAVIILCAALMLAASQ